MSGFDDDAGEGRREGFEDQIKRMSRAEQFVPFTVVVASGDRYPVTSGFSLAIGDTTMSSIYLSKRGQACFRQNQIVSIEVGEVSV